MSRLAVIVIDMLNPYRHDDADVLAEHVSGILEPMRTLIGGTQRADADLVYVNDNYGDFVATRHDLVDNALAGKRPDLIEPILPPEGADFVTKVRHSAFYSTSLEYLLRQREIETVVLAGQVTEQCILYTALDAYVRHFSIRIACDAVAPIDSELGDAALRMTERNMQAKLLEAAACFDDV